jgi:hypothetical protein
LAALPNGKSVMIHRTIKPVYNYGRSSGRAKCSKCGSVSRLSRRESHPERGPQYELQTFSCRKCGNIDTRDVETPDATGKG